MKKTLCILLLSAVSFSAQATMECKGTDEGRKISMSILDLAKREVNEGQKNPVAVRVTEEVKSEKGYISQNVLFAGVVEGVTEDVMWFMKSKGRNNYFNATIYLDDAEQQIRLGDKVFNFECEQNF